MQTSADVGAVVIGRNEGERLLRCLDSLLGQGRRVVYVDSGSRDGSVEAARARGAEVVTLPMDTPFTAARARNAGIAHLATGTPPRFVQFVDGDCEVRPDWLAAAQAFLEAHERAAVVCGRRRERFPGASVYNRLIDIEWDTPCGPARACGGDAMMRWQALEAVGGYDAGLIAGEEPELCLRLRRQGWEVHRIAVEMTLHDADITRLGQWWQRARRAGHAYAEGAAMHGRGPERHNVAQTRRALLWGFGIPGAAVMLALFSPWGLAVLLLWPLQVMRLARRSGDWPQAFFLTLAKIPEALGVLAYGKRRLTGGPRRLIEYK
ncbi:glycosyltransferase [Roseobacter sp. S98]|uniref:glycosyltransferase n=1 Tax=Roseobacter algicola (ex Choi et al. 2025) (nom. illeg.) TaxID=3092138 RepID=UPI003F5153BE